MMYMPMNDKHTIILVYYKTRQQSLIQTEGLGMAKYLCTLLLHRRKAEYYKITIQNHNGDLVETVYSREVYCKYDKAATTD
jgi:hypothetical protein